MENFYTIEPEVAGGFGEHTEVDRSSGRMEVNRLHYKFDGWLGDHLLESTPCFIASKRLAEKINLEGLSGVEIDEVEITKSDEFLELHPTRELPEFVWLKVNGKAGQDDFGIAADLRLVVSRRALDLLMQMGIAHAASIDPF